MTNKDFLSQFSGENKKPDSFKEEERVKVTKEKRPVNVKLIVIILAIVLAIAGLVLFLVLRPTIEVRDFVGTNMSEVKAWIKQNDIETQGVIFREEYSFEYDEGYITYQSIEPNKKVRKNTKMDFTVSIGADPDELISVPDIESMYKEELQDWSKQNKLTKTKIISAYSDSVESGAVISYEFKGCDVDSFTRSSILNITVSKGPQPAGTVTVEDFVKQDYSVVEAWGKKNKVEIIKATKYDEIAKDLVISQSIDAKKTVKEGESLTVVVSLGKGIVVPDFTTMTDSEVDEWIEENKAYIKVKEKYSNEDEYIIEQSIATGKYISEDSKLHITKNLGDTFYLDEIEFKIVGNSYDKFKDYASELEEKGIYIDTHRKPVASDKPALTILGIYEIYDEDGKYYSEVGRLPLEVHIRCEISDGSLADKVRLPYELFINEEYGELNKWLSDNHSLAINVEAPLLADTDKVEKIELKKSDGTYINIKEVDGYLSKNDTIKITKVGD